MKTHQLVQGSPEWHAHRARIFNASEAPAMMGASKYTTRAALLHEKATGITPEVSPALQALFDRGHAAEAAARPMIEDYIGDDLAPQVGTVEIDGMVLGASFDGITMMGDTVAEVKLWNEDLVAQVRAGVLDMHYVWQLEQELLVSGAERVVFVCSDGTPEKFVIMEYRAVPGRREQLIAGWRQFAADLKAYVPPAASTVEKIVAEPVEALPAPVVQVTGQLTLQDNFKVFEARLRDFLDNTLIREPKTDQDFADLDGQIKAMKAAEAALDGAEAQMLAQIQTVDQAKKTKDMLAKLVRDNRLMAEKLLAGEKERRRGEIVAGGVKALADHIAALNQRLGKPYMPQVQADFGGAVKGLKSLASMEDKVATELARAKIEASAVADKIEANLRTLREQASDFVALFPDTATIVLKAPEDLQALVTARIAQHRAAEERRAAELAERERERIRAEEAAKLQRELETRTVVLNPGQKSEFAASNGPETRANTGPDRGPDAGAELPKIVANVVPMQRPDNGTRINLSDIKDRLHPIQITAEGLAQLGFPHVASEKASKLYRESDFPLICAALIKHLQRVAQPLAA